MMLTEKDVERFFSKVGSPTEKGCRLWLAGSNGDGYGRFKVGGRSLPAHRVGLWLAAGPPPFGGACACHAPGCASRLCVAGEHLRWGTHAENMADVRAHHPVVLAALDGGMTWVEAAEAFGISLSSVRSIVREARSGKRQWNRAVTVEEAEALANLLAEMRRT